MSQAASHNARQSYVIAPPKVAALPLEGTSYLFPVNRIFCIGRNYAATRQ